MKNPIPFACVFMALLLTAGPTLAADCCCPPLRAYSQPPKPKPPKPRVVKAKTKVVVEQTSTGVHFKSDGPGEATVQYPPSQTTIIERPVTSPPVSSAPPVASLVPPVATSKLPLPRNREILEANGKLMTANNIAEMCYMPYEWRQWWIPEESLDRKRVKARVKAEMLLANASKMTPEDVSRTEREWNRGYYYSACEILESYVPYL